MLVADHVDAAVEQPEEETDDAPDEPVSHALPAR
jgi:hypothetical protein